MSLIELIETYKLPNYGMEAFKTLGRQIAAFKLSKARRNLINSLRSQYYVTSATRDLKQAATRNEDIVISSVIIALALCFAFAVTAGQFVLLFLRTAYQFSMLTGASMALLTLVVVGVLSTIGGWLLAFTVNMLSIAVMEGATRKQNRSIRSTLQRSLGSASRVTNAWVLIMALIFMPIFIGAILGVLYIRAFVSPATPSFSLMYKAVAVAVVWTIFVLANYSLVPQIALFEPEVSLFGAFKRSRQLVKRKGRIFLASGSIILGSSAALAYELAQFLKSTLGLDSGPVFITSLLLIILFAQSLCVMLYRKRKLARRH